MTAPEATPADQSIRDLEQRWKLSRNGLKARARALAVELKRISSTLTVWPGEFIDLGQRLHEHLETGLPMGSFPGLPPVTDHPVPSRQQEDSSSLAITAPAQTAQLAALVEAIRQTAPATPADPLRTARLLAEAADLGITLSTAELAEAIGVSHGTVNKWSDGHSPRPGIVLRRHQEAAGNLIWWAVERTAGSAHLVPARQLSDSTGMGRPVGFAAVIEAHVVDVTGSDLLDRMRIG